MGLNSVEFLVSLGLLAAYSQIEKMRDELLKSVKIDSSAFKDIERFLNRIAGLADGLKGKMNTAFLTSNNAKTFLKLYQDLLNGLETAKGKFTSLGLNDISFSAEDTQAVENMVSRIKTLELLINSLLKGKVGNLFSDDSIAGAQEVRDVIDKLKLDINNLSFNKLSTAINSELEGTKTLITEVGSLIEGLKGLIDTLSTNKIASISNDVAGAINNSTSKITFKNENLTEYRKILDDFYNLFSDYLGNRSNNVKAGSLVSTFLKGESESIDKGIAELKTKSLKYAEAINQLQDIINGTLTSRNTTRANTMFDIETIAKRFGISMEGMDTSHYKEVANLIMGAILDLMADAKIFSNPADYDVLLKKMLDALLHIFDNADVSKVISTNKLLTELKTILSNLKIDSSEIDFSKIILAANTGDTNGVLTAFIELLEQYKLKLIETELQALKTKAELEQLLTSLETANTVVNNLNGINTSGIKLAKEEIQQLKEQIQELINKYNLLAGTNLSINTLPLENGQKAIEGTTQSLQKLELRQKSLGNIQMAVSRWMGFWQVLNMTKSAIQDMKSHVEELDLVMTKIAVVTNMSLDDLWNLISSYSLIATLYGVAIKGVYEVSLIYYQLGLLSNDVMTLTTETLKMARIAGLDYATAADYMTSAIRGFKLEMSDAAHVTDVFSALAATTASSTEEIAVAISKTAASAANVGASFEATSAMMATMIATTRESATNIGTALKSIISRYGEMTSNPNATKDSEGEEMSLNRVDAALKTVGITLQTTAGQFRDFDDVMLELAEKWDTIDTNTQRYIATIMAGNRQQSRFLALISNVDEYKKALATATNSEGAGELQTLKTLDSIDAKIEKMKVTIQEFYTSSGILDLYKGILDTITNVVSAANSLPKIFGNIPGLAIALGALLVSTIKSVLLLIIASISTGLESIKGNTENVLLGLVSKFRETGVRGGLELVNGVLLGTLNLGTAIGGQLGTLIARYAGAAMQLVGSGITILGMSQYGASTSEKEDVAAGRATLSGSLLSAGGAALSSGVAGFAMGGPAGAVVGILSGIATNLPSILTSLDMLNPSLDRIIELDEKAQQKAEEEVTRAKGEEYSLEKAALQLKELEEALYDSAEASLKYIDYMNQLKDTYPELVSQINLLGDATITTTDLEEKLALARLKTASASINAIEAEIKTEQDKLTAYKQLVNGTNVSLYYNPTEMEQFLYNLGPSGNPHLYATNNWAEGKGNIYQLMINYAMKNLMTSGHEWWDYFGQPFSIDTVTPELALEWMEIHPELEDTFVRWMLTDENNNNRKSEYQLGILRSGVHDLLEDIPDSLDLSLSEITEITDFKLEDLNDMDNDLLIKILDNIKRHASDYIKSTETTLKTYEETLNRAKTDRDITTYINNLSGRETTFSDKADILTQYASLMGFILDAKFDGYEDINANENIGKTDELAKWLILYSDLAERLLNVDYSLYRNLYDFYEDFEGLEGSAADNGWKEAFTAARTTAITGLLQLIKNVFGLDSQQFSDLIDNKAAVDWPELNTNVISLLRSGISEYSTLLAHGQTVMAQNYLSGLSATFKAVGLLDSEHLSEIFDILKNVDLSDRDSLLTAIDALTELGPEYDNVIKALTDAQERIVINVLALALLVLEGLSDYASSILKIVDNIGKEMSYADALKTAIELVNKDSSLNIKDLITETDTGKWILTSEGIKLSLALAKKTLEDNLAVLKENAELLIGWYETIINSNANGGVSAAMQALGSSGVSGTELLAAQVQIDLLYTDYLEWIKQEENIGKSFTDYISIQKEEVQKILDEAIMLGEDIDKTTATSYLKSYDYKNVLTGKYTSRLNLQDILKTTIESAVENFDEQEFDAAFAELFNGNFEKWNLYLSEIGLGNMTISSTDLLTILRAQYEKYYLALIELTSGKAYSQMSEITKELTGITEDTDLSDPTQLLLAAERLLQAIQNYYINGIITFTEWQESLSSTLIKLNENAEYGKLKKLLDSMKDGFSAKELEEVGALVLENGQVTLKGAWSNLLEIDKTTGDYKVKAEAAANGIEWVVLELAKAYGIVIDKTSKGYRDAISSGVDQRITELNASNIGKQGAEALSKISNAKTGDLINISGTSRLFKQTLRMHGFNVSEDGILSIGTELELNDAILSLEDLLNNSVLEPAVKDSILIMIDSLKSKMNKNTGLSGIISESVSQSSALSFALAFDHTTKNVKSLMEDMGFIWDELTQTYIAGNDSITKINNKIAELETEPDANREAINNLKAAAANLERSLGQKKNDSIATVLTNYANVSEEAVAAFNTAFDGLDLNDYLTTDEFGIKSLDIGKLSQLKTLLKSFGVNVDALFSSQLYTIANAYMSDVTSAVSLVTSGTTNTTDLDKILQTYLDIVEKNATFDTIFDYSDVLDGWVLKPELLLKLVASLAQQLKELGILREQDIDLYIADNTTKKLAEEIDFTSFLNAESKTGIEGKKLFNALKNYYASINDTVSDANINAIINRVAMGGNAAIDEMLKIAKVTGTELSSEDIEAAYRAQINRYSDAFTTAMELSVNDVVSESIADVLRATGEFQIDNNGVIKSIGNLENAFKTLYKAMKDTNVATIAELNEAYANILTAKDKGRNDLLSILENASGISYADFGSMLAEYGITLESVMIDNLTQLLGIIEDGFGNFQFTNILAFTNYMNSKGANWNLQDPRMLKSFSTYADAQAELINRDSNMTLTITDELKSITEIKPGEAVNVAYLSSVLQEALSKENSGLAQYLLDQGVIMQNGILMISANTDIAGVVNRLSEEAGEAASLIPEQMGELKDAIVSLISSITNLISSGISGNLNNADAASLLNWADKYNLGKLQFTLTAEGLKLSNDSARMLYNTLSSIDSLLGHIVFNELYESLVKTEDEFESVSKITNYIKDLEKDITDSLRLQEQFKTARYEYNVASSGGRAPSIEAFNNLNGNANMYNRPNILHADGTYSTILGTEFTNYLLGEQEAHILMTPIPEWAEVESDILPVELLEQYLNTLMELNPVELSMDKLLELDAEGLDIQIGDELKHVNNLILDVLDATATTVDEFHEGALELHEWSDAWESAREGIEAPNDDEYIALLKEELSLVLQILAIRSTSEDSSFKFMDNDIPAGQNNPINYYENWGKAWSALKTGVSEGYIEYQDWYNIATEMNNIAGLSGQKIELAGVTLDGSMEAAAAAIEKGAESLAVTTDGSIKVDLSNFNIDLTSGADSMQSKVDEGISALADSLISMLDSLISLMEVIVAMELLTDVDTDLSGTLDFDEIFTVDLDTGAVTGYTTTMQNTASAILSAASADENVMNALKSVKINNISLKTLLEEVSKGNTELGIDLNAFVATMNSLYQAATSNDYDLDNIAESIYNILNNSGLTESVTVDVGTKTFFITGNSSISIDWNDKKALTDAKEWVKDHDDDLSGTTARETVENLIAAYNSDNWENFTVEKQATILMGINLASKKVTVKRNSGGKKGQEWIGEYGGLSFTGSSEEEVKDSISKAMVAESEGYTFTTTDDGATLNNIKRIGKTKIKLIFNPDGTKSYEINGKTFDDEDTALAYAASLGLGNLEDAGLLYSYEGKTYRLIYDSKLGVTYSFNITDGTYVYNNRTFADKLTMADFIAVAEPLLSDNTWTVKSNDDFELISKGSAKIIRNLHTGEMMYEYEGIRFESAQAFSDFMYAKKLSENGGKFVYDKDSDTATTTFIFSGLKVTLVTDAHGHQEYTCDIDGTGDTVKANSLTALLNALAVKALLSDATVTPKKGDSATITVDGQEVTILWIDGLVVVETPEGFDEDTKKRIEEAAKNAAESNDGLSTTANESVNVTTNSVNIILGPNPNVLFGSNTGGEGTENIPTDGLSIPAISATTDELNISLAPGANVNIDTKGAEEGADAGDTSIDIPVIPTKDANFDNQVTQLEEVVEETNPKMEVEGETTEASEKGSELKTEIEGLDPLVTIKVSDNASSLISNIKSDLAEMSSKTYKILILGNVTTAKGNLAKGNVAFASGNQKTLMGELGPELVVSNGRYFVVGQSGAEMVDLPKDAIVFNHQQTASLLANGHSGRGKAVTNETNAVSFAKGNIQGPAMASASAALATLKQLKAMWESLQDASIQDLAGKAGGGGGGGSGSSSSSDRKSWVEDVERWYNLMLKIAQLETDITLQETLRTKLNSDFKKNGKAYYESLKATLDMLDLQLIAQNELNISRQAYFTKRLGQLNKEGVFKDLYEFDENGQLKYKDFKKAKTVSFTNSEGKTITNTYKNGFEFLSDLTAKDDNGESKYTVEEQYNLLKAMGYEKLMKYDSSGNEITKEYNDDGTEKEDQSTFYTNSIQAAYDLMESQKTEMLDLHDAIEDGLNKMNELMNDRNEILKEIRDNQMSVELDVLNAIVDSRQRLIDDLQDQRDALEDSTSKYIQGLTDQLNAERLMYENQESQTDLDTKRRKLAVLQRSGGSSSEIASLQDEIRSAELDMYFDKFQELIDAILDASDREIERLDALIDLMTETLNYQKENGLLWESVYEIMNGLSGAGIVQYIMDHNSQYWADSPLKKSEDMESLLFKSDQWVAFRDDLKLSNQATKDALAENKITTSDIHSAVYGTDQGETEWKMMNKSMTDLYGKNWSKTAKNIGDKFEKQYATSGDISDAVDSVLLNKKVLTKTGLKWSTNNSGKSGKSNSEDSKGNRSTKISGGNGDKNGKGASTSETYLSIKVKGDYVIFTDENGKVTKKPKSKITDEEKKMYNLKFSKGGLARFTGLAQLDGTQTEPEAVLTLAQTAVLRNDILGNSRNSLLNLLVDFRSVVSGMNSAAAYTGTSNDNSVAIQNASVNMYVDSIDNNYGAQQAGDKVMDEILRIARKSGANNSVGR